jgi:hypothetical protein
VGVEAPGGQLPGSLLSEGVGTAGPTITNPGRRKRAQPVGDCAQVWMLSMSDHSTGGLGINLRALV